MSSIVAVAVLGRGLVDPGEPLFAVDDVGMTRGQAAFETIRVYAGRPFALEAHLDVTAIREARFTVVIDPVNGAGGRCLQPFADRLGFKLVAINAEESGYPAHDPEPRPRNASKSVPASSASRSESERTRS